MFVIDETEVVLSLVRVVLMLIGYCLLYALIVGAPVAYVIWRAAKEPKPKSFPRFFLRTVWIMGALGAFGAFFLLLFAAPISVLMFHGGLATGACLTSGLMTWYRLKKTN